MLKQIKTLGLALIVGFTMVGCTDIESYKEGRTDVSEEYQALPDDLKKGHRDGEKFAEDIDMGFDVSPTDVVDRGVSLYKEGTIENMEQYFSGVLEKISFTNSTDEAMLALMLGMFNIEMSIEEEQVQQPANNQQVQQQYCEWCQSHTNHTSNEHIGQCYECGTEMKVTMMTFDGRAFHCGCETYSCQGCGKTMNDPADVCEHNGMTLCRDCTIQAVENEERNSTMRCEGCDGNYKMIDMLEDENGIMYCYSCYNEIMNAKMGGPANGDLEE